MNQIVSLYSKTAPKARSDDFMKRVSESTVFGGTQTGQIGSYQKGRFIPAKPKLLYFVFFDTTPFISL